VTFIIYFVLLHNLHSFPTRRSSDLLRSIEALSYQHANQGISSVSHLVLYFWPGACSIAAHIVLEETGLTFEAIKVDFAAGKQREPDYLAINPRGRVPALATPWGILTETPAILRYLTAAGTHRSEEHTSELQSPCNLVCRLL